MKWVPSNRKIYETLFLLLNLYRQFFVGLSYFEKTKRIQEYVFMPTVSK